MKLFPDYSVRQTLSALVLSDSVENRVIADIGKPDRLVILNGLTDLSIVFPPRSDDGDVAAMTAMLGDLPDPC
jgi:hypothetical protein